MSGMKSITLYSGNSKPINPHYRYKHPGAAVRRAVSLAMEGTRLIQIWDLSRGKELCLVSRFGGRVTLEVRR